MIFLLSLKRLVCCSHLPDFIDMITLGRDLRPSRNHLGVDRFVTPEEFDELRRIATDIGFSRVASGPLVRSAYHADEQAKGKRVC